MEKELAKAAKAARAVQFRDLKLFLKELRTQKIWLKFLYLLRVGF